MPQIQDLPGGGAAALPPDGSPQRRFRDAMSRLAAAVTIVTTDGPAGRVGFTASAVCSVTDTPPTLLVCLNRSASVSAAVHANGVVCVNVLSADQRPVSLLFGGKTPMAQRFAAGEWLPTASGAPMLRDSLVSFDCRIASVADVGTHAILFCEVQGIAEGTSREALLYLGRAYKTLRLDP